MAGLGVEEHERSSGCEPSKEQLAKRFLAGLSEHPGRLEWRVIVRRKRLRKGIVNLVLLLAQHPKEWNSKRCIRFNFDPGRFQLTVRRLRLGEGLIWVIGFTHPITCVDGRAMLCFA